MWSKHDIIFKHCYVCPCAQKPKYKLGIHIGVMTVAVVMILTSIKHIDRYEHSARLQCIFFSTHVWYTMQKDSGLCVFHVSDFCGHCCCFHTTAMSLRNS